MKNEFKVDELEDGCMNLNRREKKLITFGRNLDPNVRHQLTIEYRGCVPWEIVEYKIRRKIDLMPENTE